MKAKIRFVKFEKAIAMQVLEMDEKFRYTAEPSPDFESKNGFKITSLIQPFLDRRTVWLRGREHGRDYDVVTRYFDDNECRDDYLNSVILALEDWAKNWPGWEHNEKKIYENKKDDFFLEV